MSPAQLSLAHKAILLVCSQYGLLVSDLENGHRHNGGRDNHDHKHTHPKLVTARQMLAYVFRKVIGIKVAQCGALLNRSAGNISRGVASFQDRLDTEPKLREAYEQMRKEIVSA